MNSGILAGISFVIALVIGFSGGVVAAVKQDLLLDRTLNGLCVVLGSAPVFWLGLLLIELFTLRFRIFPASGMYSTGHEGELPNLLWHVVLPACTAALIPIAVIFRLTRSAMAEALGQTYIQAARARGLSETTIVLRHALRNVLAPIVNITGLQLGAIFSGAMFTEVIFSWPGIGFLIFEAVGARDVPVIQAVILLTGTLFVVINLLTDLIQAWIDPRAIEAGRGAR